MYSLAGACRYNYHPVDESRDPLDIDEALAVSDDGVIATA